MQALIKEAQRHEARERLEELLLEGIESGEPIEVDDVYWERFRARLSNGECET